MENTLNYILLVDDDDATMFLHEIMAREAGVADMIYKATSGKKALDILTENQPLTKINWLIFMDINMPAFSGWETLDEIQQFDQSLQNRLHIYMTSASDNYRDIEMMKKYPVVKDFVSKPIKKELVRELFVKMLSGESGMGASEFKSKK